MRTRLRPALLRPVLLLAVGAVLLASCSGVPASAVATVNGAEISEDLFQRIVQAQMQSPDFQSLEGEQRTSQLIQVQRQIITQLIQFELVEQLADEVGVTVTEAEIDEAWEREVNLQGGEQELLDLLDSIGLTVEDARRQLAANALFTKAQDAVREQIEVDEADIEALYEQRAPWDRARASHILVETEEEANEILDLLADGADFAELAQERSRDPGSAQNGGSLGFQPRGAFVPEFDDAVWSAEEGEIVGPVQTDFGFHIIRVEEFETRTLDDVRDQLRDELVGQQFQQRFQSLQQDVFTEAEIDVNSRYGRWDPTAGQQGSGAVVADDPMTEGS